MRLFSYVSACLVIWALVAYASKSHGKKPNIVFLLSDDQDLRLGSMDYMETLKKEMVAKGASFVNHHTTTAQCCPSRVSLLRGQAAHNTNVTNVFAPGGNYEKFYLSGQVNDYLPHWIRRAGYRAEYLGKFLNGVNILNWSSPPKGWDHIEYFMEPYQTTPNRVVMSENGKTPVAFLGYHQTDVIRAKALSRLEHLTNQEKPFFLFISPTAPHVDDETGITVPCTRHSHLFPDVKAPRTPSFNPTDEIQKNKVSWVRQLMRMNAGNETWSDLEFRRRAQALVGIDEVLSDILKLLEEKGELNNTYVIYTSDNGYHLGQHRMAVGKATPYAEDTNLPFVVRGPGVPSGVESKLVGSHIDLAPTFLDISGLAKEDWPPFLDGRSLLGQWKDPSMKYPQAGQGGNHEIINIEYWGASSIVVPGFTQSSPNNTYKSLRIAGQGISYLYTKWCGTNEVELYNTIDDPYELYNLAQDPDTHTVRLMKRLNAVLLVTKSCAETSCRNIWQTLSASKALPAGANITSLKQAMDPEYDGLFDSFPEVSIAECLKVQLASNEVPFWPPEAASLATSYRNHTPSLGPSYKFAVKLGNERPEGGPRQRHATLEEILAKSRELTRDELDPLQPRILRSSG
ncbi:hypothetical protein NM208_g3795 [Fusarium decemcellulare]|uniref:Uncharacterized protein n=1 Tax=Fusarium decemcellulare TaxID=57161 RepID=A0ACC1SMU7_9HYPO|nr:hypothetical protein NM208_g3795 [Fusarium decemcellulare]